MRNKNENVFPKRVGKCPWCNSEIRIQAIYTFRKQYEWEACHTPRCPGTYKGLITDYQGFVIHPEPKRGYYIF